ncbi:hypothetical protein K469DRAFT_754822 [Zopfia rhizophila CBS 207.26]|uniref:Uncharacterized protein n=1 Tax=Zopfia rhizophila CBS 207.26 TaxID=1314779 RepID=A0A6A6DEE1_9PEZI|nr:hypothetical protein K469DRAFT_754822 [Zopfia rhizophila CBS 207.26]
MAAKLQNRAATGKHSTTVIYQGRPVDSKKIRMHLKEAARKESKYVVLKSIPTGDTDSSPVRFGTKYPLVTESNCTDLLSPLTHAAPTPDGDIDIATPPPVSETSPNDAPSPTANALQTMRTIDRAHLFVQG